MSMNQLNMMVGGAAGLGVKTAGEILARLCTRAGRHVFGNVEYPSVIRGDHNSYQIVAGEAFQHGHRRELDLLLALDDLAATLHKDEIRPGGVLVHDSEKGQADLSGLAERGVMLAGLPFPSIVKEAGGDKRLLNAAGLGAVLGLLGLDREALAAACQDAFARFGEAVLAANLAAARLAWERTSGEMAAAFDRRLAPVAAPPRMLVTGNEALAIGALKAGLKFYAGYPMTPASSIMTYLARRERDYGIVVKHAEDEISAIGMAVGAGVAGVRAMTGTSGGGFCLMCEFLGLAGMTETPLVVVESQRPGPATGLPTRTEQGDLTFVLAASQGDFPRIVIAPGDPAECFRWGFEAFNLAERYQTPVILLLDKHLSESTWTYAPFATDGLAVDRGVRAAAAAPAAGADLFPRHAVTESGVSPALRPGTPGATWTTTGDAHDDLGRISEEEGDRVRQMDKILGKTRGLDAGTYGWTLHGPPEAALTIVGWGSTTQPILGALADLGDAPVNFLQVRGMNPFPAEAVAAILARSPRAVLVENNATAQLGDLIAERASIRINDTILKYSGRQFLVDELAAAIGERL
ncbi:MAG: 2-oxoacid:acceptor oxidoreductase subunit alpha [Candidatus Krumholzibacteriota bacterium]|nr:2-oxoacid:acceptor oxidoreductase subunit alpha [Candidatus Krumholzibacteriota bacterium]